MPPRNPRSVHAAPDLRRRRPPQPRARERRLHVPFVELANHVQEMRHNLLHVPAQQGTTLHLQRVQHARERRLHVPFVELAHHVQEIRYNLLHVPVHRGITLHLQRVQPARATPRRALLAVPVRAVQAVAHNPRCVRAPRGTTLHLQRVQHARERRLHVPFVELANRVQEMRHNQLHVPVQLVCILHRRLLVRARGTQARARRQYAAPAIHVQAVQHNQRRVGALWVTPRLQQTRRRVPVPVPLARAVQRAILALVATRSQWYARQAHGAARQQVPHNCVPRASTGRRVHKHSQAAVGDAPRLEEGTVPLAVLLHSGLCAPRDPTVLAAPRSPFFAQCLGISVDQAPVLRRRVQRDMPDGRAVSQCRPATAPACAAQAATVRLVVVA